MASRTTSKKQEAKVEEPVAEEAKVEEPSVAETPDEAPEPAPASEKKPAEKPSNAMITVTNLKRLDYVQPSTGIRIHGFARKVKVLDDAWIALQIKAGLMERS